jgi:hypothetical protein
MTRVPVIAATLITLAAFGFSTPANASTSESSASTSSAAQIATFEGTTFDMTRGWGLATACNVTDNGTACYRTEAEMNKAVDRAPGAGRAANCSSALRLYDGTGYTGQVISITTRSTVLALYGYGFDNKTSSYKVGACSARLYNGIGSSQYGGTTSAGASATSMASGWDNVISSVTLS